MTWNGKCPECGGFAFELTVNSDGDVHVNCANCFDYIGKMQAGTMFRPPVPEEH